MKTILQVNASILGNEGQSTRLANEFVSQLGADEVIVRDLAKKMAETAGFDGIALTEHHASGYNTFGDNVMMAAHLAPQVRTGVRFILAILVPPLHHPMRLAPQRQHHLVTERDGLGQAVEPLAHPVDMPMDERTGFRSIAFDRQRDDHGAARAADAQRHAPRGWMVAHLDRRPELWQSFGLRRSGRYRTSLPHGWPSSRARVVAVG